MVMTSYIVPALVAFWLGQSPTVPSTAEADEPSLQEEKKAEGRAAAALAAAEFRAAIEDGFQLVDVVVETGDGTRLVEFYFDGPEAILLSVVTEGGGRVTRAFVALIDAPRDTGHIVDTGALGEHEFRELRAVRSGEDGSLVVETETGTIALELRPVGC